MNKSSIIEVEVEDAVIITKLTPQKIVQLLRESPVRTLEKYDFSDEQLFKYRDCIPKSVFIKQNISENLLLDLLVSMYFSPDDLTAMSMKTYSNLSDITLTKYASYINFEKLAAYLIADDRFDITKYEKYITIERSDKFWDLVSTMQLPIYTLEKYEKNINWDLYFTTNSLSEDIKNRFPEIVDKHYKVYIANDSTSKTADYMIEVENRIEFDIDSIEDLINKIN